MKILTIKQTRELDSRTASEFGIPTLTLMENAGQQLANHVLRFRKKNQNGSDVIIFCGKGNNAGDGFVAARLLAGNKINVTLFLTSEPDSLKGDAAENFTRLKNLKLKLLKPTDETLKQVKNSDKPLIILDALLGTGFKPPLRPDFLSVINGINDLKSNYPTKIHVISVDIPSGLSGDEGYVNSPCVRADETITLAVMKKGLTNQQNYTGQISIVDIGIPEKLINEIASLSN